MPGELFGAQSYLVSVTRRAALLKDVLVARGCRVGAAELDNETPSLLLVSARSEQLPDWIAEVAVEHEVPVIELIPLPAGAHTDPEGVGAEERAM